MLVLHFDVHVLVCYAEVVHCGEVVVGALAEVGEVGQAAYDNFVSVVEIVIVKLFKSCILHRFCTNLSDSERFCSDSAAAYAILGWVKSEANGIPYEQKKPQNSPGKF